MFLASCDPGRITGLSLFVDGVLQWTGTPCLLGDEFEYKSFIRVASLALPPELEGIEVDRFVGEIPQVRREGKGDPNQLLPLVGVVFRILTLLQATIVQLPTPEEWKGSVPKHIHNNRIMSKLTSAEKERVDLAPVRKSDLHNIIDSVGLGLWSLGRLRR